MAPSTKDRNASAHPISAARNMIRTGPATPSRKSGRLRAVARRSLIRLMRPFGVYQRMVDENLVTAIADLERRLTEQEQRTSAPLMEDMAVALEALRTRIADGEDVIAGSRARPYAVPGVLDNFRVPISGTVLGYRGLDEQAASTYAGFEDVFRGEEERVRERQRIFLSLLEGHDPVLDVGCGRGEFLDLLQQAGVSYMGVDTDDGMVKRCREKGHKVELGTGNDLLEGLEDDSLGAVFSAQVIEHIPYADLVIFFDLARAKLRTGGMFIAETVNPHAPHALKTFWVDPTHEHPLFPETVLVLCRLAGFSSAYVFHPLGTGHVDVDRVRESAYAVVATK